jgi:hypothetical protein
MKWTVYVAIFGFIPLVIYLFSIYEGRKAAAISFIVGWLFLPVANIPIPAISTFGKIHTICFAILIGAFVHERERLSEFTFKAIDLPIILFCLSPLFASLSNGLGLYDGIAATRDQTISWGLPYFVGRIFLTDLDALKILVLWIFIGGLIYVPFCLFEMRMSPQLHMRVYGFFQHPDFSQTLRAGGYRPMVFMNHGIMVGIWMASASLIAIWLYGAGVLQENFGTRARTFLIILLLTTVGVKSFGALILLMTGLGILFLTKVTKKSIFILLMMIIPLFYLGGRISGVWNGDNLVTNVSKLSPERADSLGFRLANEDILIQKAMQRPIFGWGGWGRARVYNEEGEDISVTDGQWIIVLGNLGLFGLVNMILSILLPVFLMVKKFPARLWAGSRLAPVSALAILLVIYMIDALPDAMPNPTFMFIAGGLSSLSLQQKALSPETGMAMADVGATMRLAPIFISKTRLL